MSERVATAIRLPKPLHERLHKEADERMISVNLIVCRAVEDFLEKLIPVEELK